MASGPDPIKRNHIRAQIQHAIRTQGYFVDRQIPEGDREEWEEVIRQQVECRVWVQQWSQDHRGRWWIDSPP